MRYFYYLKTADKELTYQDEEVIVPKEEKEAIATKIASKDVEVFSKAELQTEIEAHKVEIYDAKTDTKTVVDAKTSTCLIRWDGRSPYYELVKGTAPEAVPFLGWPQVSKEDFIEPVDEPVKDIIEEKPVDSSLVEEVAPDII